MKPHLPENWQLDQYLAKQKERIEAFLSNLPQSKPQVTPALAAFQYALTNGGKRFRPLLTLATADLYQMGSEQGPLCLAAAIECLHCASLVLDDLPCMDNAMLRRGKPTTHREYGEAQAVLAAMALVAEANLLLIEAIPPKHKKARQLVIALNDAYGLAGLSTGQSLDLKEEKPKTLKELEIIHANKTGALFQAAVILPGLLADAPKRELGWLSAYARNLGLAFQVKDDLLDGQSSSVTGKDTHQDEDKINFVNLIGVAASEKLYEDLMQAALAQLEPFGKSSFHLRALTHVIWKRQA
ncbi:MAG: polyprenyl synthetase family protein [Acidobacteria bacterium]|nr:polyprenyl synthetase family protein [Acidobacteriota bacterium]